MEIKERFLVMVASYAALYDVSNDRRVGWQTLLRARKVTVQELRRGHKPAEVLAFDFVSWAGSASADPKRPAWLKVLKEEEPLPDNFPG